jgi:type IV secretory pathway TraG/TraD family ATPase VirD4
MSTRPEVGCLDQHGTRALLCVSGVGANTGAMSDKKESGILYLAHVDYRNDRRVFGIKHEDRFSHLYIIGKTGTGKSTLVERVVLQDLELGNGLALIDPHGDLAERVAARIPTQRQSDVIYFNAADPAQPFGYNPLRHFRADRIALAASGLLETFKKRWPEAWGVRMENILRNVLMGLLCPLFGDERRRVFKCVP